MATLHSSSLIKHLIKQLPPSPVFYWPAYRECSFTTDWKEERQSQVRKIELVPFHVAQLGTEYTVHCIAASGKFTASAQAQEADANVALAELRAVVGAIKDSRLLPVSPDLDHLLTQAAQAHGAPNDIEEWAHQLSADVSGLTD